MNQEKTCLFVLLEDGKWGINHHFKNFNAIFNGAGWYIENKYQQQVRSICQEAKMQILDFPLTGDFEELRRQHKSSFFEEKSIKTQLKIDVLKNQLGLKDIDLSDLLQEEYSSKLEQIPEGKQLLDLVNQKINWEAQIKKTKEEDKISKISIKQSFEIPPYNLDDLLRELKQTKEGLRTGYKKLDEMVRIPNEAITLIGGRPSHGKTTFMLNLFLNMVEQYPDLHFYFFSYEETKQQIATKIINILSGWVFEESKNLIQLEGYLKVESTSFGMVEKGKQKYQEFVESGRLRICSDPFYAQQIPSVIDTIKSKVPLGAVFIDYIQKIKNKNRFGMRQLELANTSDIILETAKKFSIPIILGAQLGRDKDSRDKVKLENLREAGDLEQDANLVLGIFNPSMEKSQDEQRQLTDRKVDLKITPLKNRNGIANKTIVLEFDRPLLKISEK